ncbi:hypothetical protein N2152v2_003096 [Parachlorella kessleri]
MATRKLLLLAEVSKQHSQLLGTASSPCTPGTLRPPSSEATLTPPSSGSYSQQLHYKSAFRPYSDAAAQQPPVIVRQPASGAKPPLPFLRPAAPSSVIVPTTPLYTASHPALPLQPSLSPRTSTALPGSGSSEKRKEPEGELFLALSSAWEQPPAKVQRLARAPRLDGAAAAGASHSRSSALPRPVVWALRVYMQQYQLRRLGLQDSRGEGLLPVALAILTSQLAGASNMSACPGHS